MNQDKTLVGPEIENLSNRRQVKIIENDAANQRCIKKLPQEYGSMPYPGNRKIVKMIVMSGGNKRHVFQEVPQDFVSQELVARRCPL